MFINCCIFAQISKKWYNYPNDMGVNMGLIKDLISQIDSDFYKEKFLEIYKDEKMLEYQKKRYKASLLKFADIYKEDDVNVFSAPGRSEVMGNHTDHQHGEILAAGINLDAIAVAKEYDDGLIKIVSGEYPMITVDTKAINEAGVNSGKSKALIEGVCKGFTDRGYKIGGFRAYITSDVLIGAGLS